MGACANCEKLPAPMGGPRVLHVAPPVEELLPLLRSCLTEGGLRVEERHAGVLSIPFTPESAMSTAEALGDNLSDVELSDYHCIVLPPDREPRLGDLAACQSLERFIARIRGQWLAEMLRHDRLTTVFQPIVPADNPRQVFGYECLLRGREADGAVVSPARIYDAAHTSELLHFVDRQARRQALLGASRQAVGVNCFINFYPSSIYDPRYCMRSFLELVEELEVDPCRIIFEVVQTHEIRDPDHLARVLDFYRDRGFRVALDDLGGRSSSLGVLAALQPDFLKIDAEIIRGADSDRNRSRIAARLIHMAHDLRISSIAEGIETPSELEWARNHGVDYVQGYYIAHPASPPPLPAMV